MLDCTTDNYDHLYARWLGDPGRLLALAGWRPGMKLLDLCGGTGAITQEAIRQGGSPSDMTLLDLNPRWNGPGGVRVVKGRAESIGFLIPGRKVFDVVICRQAMAYIHVDGLRGRMFFAGLALLMKTGGQLVFNTFARPKWAWKDYEHDGRAFSEASGFVGRRVFHMQWAKGAGGGMDFTTFHWHDDDDLYQKLDHGFSVLVVKSEKSRRWVCTRRPHV